MKQIRKVSFIITLEKNSIADIGVETFISRLSKHLRNTTKLNEDLSLTGDKLTVGSFSVQELPDE